LVFGHARALAVAWQAECFVIATLEPDRRLTLRDKVDDVVFGADVVPEAEEGAHAAFLWPEVELLGRHPLDSLVEKSVHGLERTAQDGVRCRHRCSREAGVAPKSPGSR